MAPQRIGRYTIIRELGRGGMATVYLGLDPDLQREVAIKVLPRQFTHDPRFLQRFRQEARTIAALEHYAIVPIHGFGEEDDAPYLVMRYMSGGSLRERMAGEALPLAETSRILNRLAPALDKAHQRGIIHRDLKPDNVLFDEDGQPYLADFGIARMAEATHTMTVVGTPSYMSPEQVEGQQKLDWRSDIYGLGVMLFEMLSGRQPYTAQTPAAQMLMHIREPVPDLLAANAELPLQAQAIIDKAMAKNREARYQTAAEMSQAVQRLLYAPAVVAAPPLPPAQPTVLEIQTPAAEVVDPAKAVVGAEVAAATMLDTPPEEKAAKVPREGSEPRAGTAPAVGGEGADGPGLRGLLPAWAWWLGALAVVLLLVFGIRAVFDGGGQATPEAAEDNAGSAAAGVPTVTVTNTSVPPVATEKATAEASPTPVPPTPTPRPTATLDPNVPPPDAELGTVWPRPRDKMPMRYVPSGTFPMGSEEHSDEQPVHEVTLDGFWIDETEVSNVQYRECVDAGECSASDYAGDATYNGDDYPVVGVSWEDADSYCRWAGGRLPSEAQWEYAARGPDGNTYPWGEAEPTCDLAQFGDCSGNTVPVGSYADGASWVGALDMAGNVWEWVNDWYDSDYYDNSPAKNPEGPESGEYKVLRGGGWRNGPINLRGADRDNNDPEYRNTDVGFRCALPGK